MTTEYTIIAETYQDACIASDIIDVIMDDHTGPLGVYYWSRRDGPIPYIDTGYIDAAGLDIARRRLARRRMYLEKGNPYGW